MGLEYLRICNCQKLEKLPRRLDSLMSSGELILGDCPSLVAFPEKGLPSKLKNLYVSNCWALQSRTGWAMGNNYSLEDLKVFDCASLTNLSSSKGGLPSTLKRLGIFGCEKLESILPDAVYDINLRNLGELEVVGCNNLESLPEGWFPATNLRKLLISDCEKLESLPHRLYNNLSSLEELSLSDSPAAGRIFSYFVNNDQGRSYRRLTNLTSLTINGIKINKPPSEWDLLNRFSSLKELCIDGEDMVSFPEDGMLLPTSLMELTIHHSLNLEKLSSNGFQKLSSVQKLSMTPSIVALGSHPFQSKGCLPRFRNCRSLDVLYYKSGVKWRKANIGPS